MRFEGTRSIRAPRDRVWAWLIDPREAGRCIPGIGGIEILDPTHFQVTKVGLSTIRANIRVNVEMSEMRVAEHVRLEAKGRIRGVSVAATAEIDLSDGAAADTTVITWSIDVAVSGPLAAVGGRMIDRGAGPIIAQTLRCMEAQLTEPSIGRPADVASASARILRFDPQWCLFWGLAVKIAQLETWIPYLERSRYRFAIMTLDDIGEEVRERLDGLSNVRIVEPYLVGIEWLTECRGFRGYLYVGARQEYYQTVNRHPDVVHVFIAHGESGEGGSGFRSGSLYDAVFVADYAAVRRFQRAIRPWVWRRAIATGATVVDGLHKDAWDHPRRVTSILYAPTWEGNPGDDHSSLDRVVPVLTPIVPELAAQGIDVLFLPHPATGDRRPELLDAVAQLHEAGTVTGLSTAEAFERADVLIGDISGVTAEFLFTGKPVIMPVVPRLAALGVDASWLDLEYPWVYRWDTTAGGLLALLRAIETRDPLRARRASEAKRKFRHHRSIDDAVRTFDLALDTLTWRDRPIPLRVPFESKVLADRLRARLRVRC